MTVIRIKEFFGYSLESFSEFLHIHRKSFIEVIVPKEYDDTVPGLLAEDYYRAMYAGQLLCRISDDFLFTCPPPGRTGEFGFIVITSKWKTLARLLFLLSQAYDADDNLDAYLAFSETASDDFSYLRQNEKLACPAYFDIIEDYFAED
jgi:hypothetical protein